MYPPIPNTEQLFVPATEDLLRAFESMYGLPLPADYRDFLRSVNGVRFTSADNATVYPLRERWQREHAKAPSLIPALQWPPDDQVLRDLVGMPAVLLGLSEEEHPYGLRANNDFYAY